MKEIYLDVFRSSRNICLFLLWQHIFIAIECHFNLGIFYRNGISLKSILKMRRYLTKLTLMMVTLLSMTSRATSSDDVPSLQAVVDQQATAIQALQVGKDLCNNLWIDDSSMYPSIRFGDKVSLAPN